MLQKEVETVFALKTKKGYIVSGHSDDGFKYSNKIAEAKKYDQYNVALMRANSHSKSLDIPIYVIPYEVEHIYKKLTPTGIREELIQALLNEVEKEELSHKEIAHRINQILDYGQMGER